MEIGPQELKDIENKNCGKNMETTNIKNVKIKLVENMWVLLHGTWNVATFRDPRMFVPNHHETRLKLFKVTSRFR